MQLDTSSEFGALVDRRLKAEETIWLTTVDRGGTPQPTPVWFHWNGEDFLIFSQPNVAKIRNITANRRVALNFNTGEDGDNVAVFIGEARVADGPAAESRVAAYMTKYAEGIKRLNTTPESLLAEFSAVILVTPEKVRGWP
jgi:PPOX class probable F420-dependent enzyme